VTAIFLSSGNLLADRRFEWARDCADKGDAAGAADLLAQALELAPAFASAWFTLGELRARGGDRDGAVAAFEHARAADPEDRHGAALHLTTLGGSDAAMPPAYVRALFDGYAQRFDDALTGNLKYVAPELLRDAVREVHAGKFQSMLDLGCGTGLAGTAFRSHAGRLTGVDLSPAMLAQARAKNIYDRLEEGDVVAFSIEEATRDARHDLIVAADVFTYLADLVPVIAAASRLLTPGGIFAFTVETHDGKDALLRETLRYAHGAAYVRATVAAAGLKLLRLDSAATRTEKGEPVPGLVAVATPIE
jgi:predicted TPR repeat methyltransferase